MVPCMLDSWGGAERLLGCFISQVPALLEAEQPPGRYGYKCRIQTEVTLNAMTKSVSLYSSLACSSVYSFELTSICVRRRTRVIDIMSYR